MAKDFQDLELLVAKIQKQLAPKAEIQHNVLMDGRHSARKRQVDVLVKEKVGQYDIQIVIDCKDYKKPVNVKGVEEFYGLLDDVGAQKGVLVCPKGFTASAKTRANKWQIDLYSPFDTDAHKWQVRATIPAICDFRSALISFGIRVSAPGPFKMPMDFYSVLEAFDGAGHSLGIPLHVAAARWDSGDFPSEVGEHAQIPLYTAEKVTIDNGYGTQVPVTISVSLIVEQALFFGQLPVPTVSGFKDEMSGRVITNAFTVGMLDPNEVERKWLQIATVADAPIRPVITMHGMVCWTEG